MKTYYINKASCNNIQHTKPYDCSSSQNINLVNPLKNGAVMDKNAESVHKAKKKYNAEEHEGYYP